MGQEISYCAKCAIRILSSDIEKGNAFRIGNQTVCKDCAPQVAPGLNVEELQRASQKTPRGGTALPAAAPRMGGPPPSTGTRRFVAGKPPRSKWPLAIGLCGGGLVATLAAVVLFLGGPSPAPPPPAAPPAGRQPPPRTEDSNARAARLACEKAYAYMKERPDDLEGQIAAYEAAARAAQGTAYDEQARAARDALLDRRRGDVAREMARLAEQARPFLEREDFKAALEIYAQARKKRDTADWAALIDEKIREIQKSVDGLMESVQERAGEDKRSGSAEAVKAARERVARWGLPERAAALDAFLSGIPERRPPSQGLVGWWKMDEGAGTILEDASGQGHTGRLAGTAWEQGRTGKALAFDGQQDHVQIHPFFESVRDTFTIALWAFPKSSLLVTPETDTGAAPLKGHRFAVFPSHGKHFGPGHAGVGLSIGTNGISVFEHADSHFPSLLVYSVEVRDWTHVALVVADRVPVLYVDGKRAKVGMKSTLEVHPSCELGGGSSKYGSYAGLLDDVRIYDRALSEAEVQGLAGLTVAPVAPPPAPPPPPPRADGSWRALFNGKTNECLRANCRSGWIVEREGLTRTGPSNAAQTVEEFEDGEVRLRFEVEGPESLAFYIRQGEEGKHYVKLDSSTSIKTLEGKPHDIVFTCKGAFVTAALDGSPLTLSAEGNPRKGCLQFNGTGRVIRILSIDYRPVK